MKAFVSWMVGFGMVMIADDYTRYLRSMEAYTQDLAEVRAWFYLIVGAVLFILGIYKTLK